MGEDEQKLLRAEVLDQYLSTKRRLACLRAKFDQLSKMFDLMLRFLRGETTGNFESGKFLIVRQKGDISRQQVDWPAPDALLQLARDRDDTQSELDSLERQLTDMGFGDFVKWGSETDKTRR